RTQVGYLARSEKCQDQTLHTDNVGRLRETTLRRSPLRYASDWRQDIDTAPAALRMTSSTTSGFDKMGTCEAAPSVVVLPALRAKTLQIGGNRLVLRGEDIPARLGVPRCALDLLVEEVCTGAACVAYTSFCSASGRSPAKCLTPLCLSQMR